MSGLTNRGYTSAERARDAGLAVLMAALALAPRLLGLGVFLTADEAKAWLGRAMMFARALALHDWRATFDSPAPGVTTMWTGALGLWLEYLRQGRPGGSFLAFLDHMPFDPLDPHILPMLRLPGILIAALLVVLVYGWSHQMWGRRAGLLVAAFFALDPFYLALSRILGHDGLVSGFMTASLIALLSALYAPSSPARDGQRASRNMLLVSGALGGLAFLSKYPALFLGAFSALVLLAVYVLRRGRAGWAWQQVLVYWLIDILIWSLAAGVVCLLLWPVLWVNLPGTLSAMFNDAFRASGSVHPKGSFYLGQPVADPGAGFYPLVALFKMTPVVGLGVLLALASLLGRWRRTVGATLVVARTPVVVQPTLILVAYVCLFVLLVTLGGKKQDRYILPALLATAVLAALGWAWLVERIPLPPSFVALVDRAKWSSLAAGLLVVAHMAFVLPHHPYYFTYYNPLLGGGSAASHSIIVGWGEGLDEAARWLNSQDDAENLDVVSWYSTAFEPFFRGHAIYKIEEEKISRTSKPGLAGDYVVFYVNQVQRQLPSPGALQFFEAVSPVYTVTLRGTDYAWIYPSIRLQNIIADEVRLVGQAELLGYTLTDEAGRSVNTLHPDSVSYLSLYWEWQGKAEHEPVGLSLVDADGATRGWGNPIQTVAPLPFASWQEGMIVRDDFALIIFADTPPGTYRLAAWIDRPATRETVGVFPLEDKVMLQLVARELE